MARSAPLHRSQGFTLVEVLFAMAASLVVITFVVRAVVSFYRDQGVRTKVADLQGTARQALDILELDLRHASLGSGTGVIWTASSSNRVSRPSVQVVTGIAASSSAVIPNAKAGTDAILVVESVPGTGGRTATVGSLTSSVGVIPVTDASSFAVGDLLLMGELGDASWGRVAAVSSSGPTQQLTFQDSTVNVLPGNPVPKLGPGAIVRRARARLYYVDTSDRLVRLSLTVPRLPDSMTEVVDQAVLGYGIENLQVDFQLDDGSGGFVSASDPSQPAPALSSADPIAAEALVTFGAFQTGGGPHLTAANVNQLRTLVVQVSARSRVPLTDSAGDPAVALTGASGTPVTLAAGDGAAASSTFARRIYRLVAAVRNTSSGSL